MAYRESEDDTIQDSLETNKQPLSFLDLPTELRLEIYDIFLANLSNLKAVEPLTKREITNVTAILHTCKTIFNEAGDSFMKYECRIYTGMLRWTSDERREWRQRDIAQSDNRLRSKSFLVEGRMLTAQDWLFSRTQRARFGKIMDSIRALQGK